MGIKDKLWGLIGMSWISAMFNESCDLCPFWLDNKNGCLIYNPEIREFNTKPDEKCLENIDLYYESI